MPRSIYVRQFKSYYLLFSKCFYPLHAAAIAYVALSSIYCPLRRSKEITRRRDEELFFIHSCLRGRGVPRLPHRRKGNCQKAAKASSNRADIKDRNVIDESDAEGWKFRLPMKFKISLPPIRVPTIRTLKTFPETNGTTEDSIAHNGVAHNGIAHNGVAHNGVAHNGVAHYGDANDLVPFRR